MAGFSRGQRVPLHRGLHHPGASTNSNKILHRLFTVACTGLLAQLSWFHDNSSTDISSTDISSTDISSTIVHKVKGQLYIQLLFQQIIIFINFNFYLHYDSFLSIPLPLTL